jgi:hypothetical protein
MTKGEAIENALKAHLRHPMDCLPGGHATRKQHTIKNESQEVKKQGKEQQITVQAV